MTYEMDLSSILKKIGEDEAASAVTSNIILVDEEGLKMIISSAKEKMMAEVFYYVEENYVHKDDVSALVDALLDARIREILNKNNQSE